MPKHQALIESSSGKLGIRNVTDRPWLSFARNRIGDLSFLSGGAHVRWIPTRLLEKMASDSLAIGIIGAAS